MIFHTNVSESTIIGVSAAHQIYSPRTISNGAVRQSIPRQTQKDFPSMNVSSFPRIDANGHHTQPTATFPSNNTSESQFLHEDEFSGRQSFNNYSGAFASTDPVCGNIIDFPTSSTALGSDPRSDDLFALYHMIDEPRGIHQISNGEGYYYEW